MTRSWSYLRHCPSPGDRKAPWMLPRRRVRSTPRAPIESWWVAQGRDSLERFRPQLQCPRRFGPRWTATVRRVQRRSPILAGMRQYADRCGWSARLRRPGRLSTLCPSARLSSQCEVRRADNALSPRGEGRRSDAPSSILATPIGFKMCRAARCRRFFEAWKDIGLICDQDAVD